MSQGADPGVLANSGLAFNSCHFLLFLSAAVVVLRLVAGPKTRPIALLLLNFYFFSYFVKEWGPLAFVLSLILLTWVVGELRVLYPDRLPYFVVPFVVVLLWLVLFLIKDPSFVAVVNPFHYFPVAVVGASYFIFRCIHYVMDAEAFERRDLLTLLNYVLFFPTLLAGPIERYDRFQPLHDGTEPPPPVSPLTHLHRIANGMLKKFALADNLMVFGSFALAPDWEWSRSMTWVAVFSQLALLYLDFSGYCDIVIGCAGLMGFPLAENFDKPWLARNVQEFWNRWHITLSQFLRDYFFTPLSHLTYYHVRPRWQFPVIALIYFLTMIVIALWHGITWGFFLFGALHGTAVVLLQVRSQLRRSRPAGVGPSLALAAFSGRLATYCFVSLTLVFAYCGAGKSLRILRTMIGG